MQSKLSVKTIIEESLKAKFENALKAIQSKQVQIDTNGAIKIIVAICNACHKNLPTPENINDSELVQLVKCLVKLIKSPSDEGFENYAQSVFHILKLLVGKKSFECILQLEELFIPDFMPLTLTDKHHTIYESICKCIHNVIVRTSQASDKRHSDEMLKLSYLLSSIYKKVDKQTNMFESVHNCLISLVGLQISFNHLVEFYQHVLYSLDRIEDSLYPLLMNNFSFLYTQLLKNQDHDLANACFNVTGSHLKSLFTEKRYSILWDIIEVVEWFSLCCKNPSNQPTKSHVSLKNYCRKYKIDRNLQSVCDFISSVAYTVAQLYKKTHYWLQTVDKHIPCYSFLNDIALIMAQTPYSCHCKKCTTEMNLKEALRTLNTIASLGRLSVTNKIETSHNYKLEILRYLEKFASYVLQLKESKCEEWKKHWYDLGVHLYSIGIYLYQNKDSETSILYLQRFIQNLLEFEDRRGQIIDRTYLNSAFNSIGDIYMEKQDYEKCLLVTSLSIIFNERRKNEINRWIRAKAMSREQKIEQSRELQELTLVSVCSVFRNELLKYVPKVGLRLDTKQEIEFLTYELRQYNLKWKSKIPMSSVFRRLSQIASSQCAAEIFIEIWGDGDMLVHESLPKLLKDLICQVKMEAMPKKDMLLAHLCFLQHRYRVKDTLLRHCDEMERTMNVTKANCEVINGIVPPDPNDECDLVSSYENLQISRYINIMQELNTSLDLIQAWLSKNTPESEDERERLFKLLANIGHEYSLHNNSTKSLEAWKLALKISETPLQRLQATSFIIELSDVQNPMLENLMTETEKDVDRLRTNKNFAELITYFVCKTETYFFANFQKARESFVRVLEFQKESDCSKILKARIYLLQHNFVTLPCKFRVDDHREYSLVKIHQANNSANMYYTENGNISSYDMRIFFEIYETLVKMYHDLRLPREVRCYSRDAVVIAQKLLLPLRTVCLLYYLAYADINTCRLDDAHVKIKDFSDILALANRRNMPTVPCQQINQDDICVKSLAEDFNEIVLDVPTGVSRSTSNGSPSFAAESFKLPLFLRHDKSCECFYCTSSEYHQFVLKKTYLNGLLSVYESNFILGEEFFCGCVKIYDILKEKKFEGKTSKMDERLVETYCLSKFEYANTLVRRGLLNNANNVNKEVLRILEKFNYRFIHLYNEALAQRLDIIARTLSVKQPKVEVRVVKDECDVNVRTPPSQKSEIVVSPNYNTAIPMETIKILPKSLKFDLSDNAEDLADGKKDLQNLPPFLILDNKTPVPSSSKVKVYNNKSTKKTKSKILAEIPPFKEAEFVTPKPTDREKVTQHLSNRTKLLTDRLKNSTQKSSGANENSKKGANVRQNLLSQLTDDDDSKRDETVRRSGRNRK